MTLPGLDTLPRDRCVVMGIVNVTPDSFSDGGAFLDRDAAIAHGLALVEEGADVLDIGGESTRPGAARVDAVEELRRVLPVVEALARAGAVVSIDTTRAEVAEAALDAGARIVNDVTGGDSDPAMRKLVARAGCTFVVMHSRGTSTDMQSLATYGDVVDDVVAELLARVREAEQAGVSREQVVVDPGLGFAKAGQHNLQLLRRLPELLAALPFPLLVGASRKSFLGAALGDRTVDDRDDATQATTALAAWQGAWGVRVHAVRPAADAVRVIAAIKGRAS